MADKTPVFTDIRIIPKETDFLDKKLGSRGEIFFDGNDNTLRLFDGTQVGGIALLRADLENIEGQVSSVIPAETPPTGVDPGTIWFDTNTGKIYVLYNDGSGQQWVQPSSIIYGTGGGSGGGGSGASSFSQLTGQIAIGQISNTLITPAKLNLNASLLPTTDITYDLGSATYRWRDLYLSGSSIKLGGSTITATGTSVNLPAGTTIGGSEVTAFTTIDVTGQSSITADTSADILTFVAGPGISITTNTGTDTITITNTGSGGGGASGVSTGTAARLAFYSSTGSVVQDTGPNLTWTGTNLSVTGTISASGAVSYVRAYFDTLAELTAVSAITWHGMVAHVHETGRMYFAHSNAWTPLANYSDLNTFSTITVAGQSNLVADTPADTLTLVAGTNITLTTNATADSITISSAAGISTLDGLSDVAISSPTTNQVLKYDGTNWVNGTDATSGTGTLDGLSDVIITAPATNQVLKYNGTTWVNGTDAGAAGTNTFSTIAVAGQSSVEADTSTDTLTLTAGTGISITTNAGTDTVTITSTVTGGVSTFSALTDSASQTIDKIYLPAITMLTVTNNSASSYRFDQYGTSDNPTVYAINGTTIAFNLNVAGHPFLIQDGTGTNYDTGLIHVTTSGTVTTGASAQGKTSGTLYWKVPTAISGGYRYQCSAHVGMVGNISVKIFSGI
jgi:plastocyanin